MYIRVYTFTGEVIGEGIARKFTAAVDRLYHAWYWRTYGKGDRQRTVATCKRAAHSSTSATYHVRMGYRPDRGSNTYTLDSQALVVQADYKRGELR